MITPLTADEVEARWGALAARLLTGLHPAEGDPVRAEVPVAVYDPDAPRGEALFARLERARLATGSPALYVVDYDPRPGGGVRPTEGYRVAAASPDAWRRAGQDLAWGLGGTSFAFFDDSARWVALSLVGAVLFAGERALLAPLFGDHATAAAAVMAFRERCGTPLTQPAYRALVDCARLPDPDDA